MEHLGALAVGRDGRQDALEAEGQKAEVLHLDNRRRPDWVAVRLAGAAGGGKGPRGP